MTRSLSIVVLIALLAAGLFCWNRFPPRGTQVPPDHLPSAAAVEQTAPSPPTSLAADATIRIRVLAADGGQALGGIRIKLHRQDPRPQVAGTAFESERPFVDTGRVSEKYVCVELNAPVGEWLAVDAFSDDAPLDATRTWIEPMAPGQVCDVTVRVVRPPDLLLYGQVVDVQTNRPVACARLTVIDDSVFAALIQGMQFIASHPRTYLADDTGHFMVRVASWDWTQLVAVTDDGYGPRIFSWQLGHEHKDRELVIGLVPAATLRLHIPNAQEAAMRDMEVVLEVSRAELVDDQDPYFWFAAVQGLGGERLKGTIAEDGWVIFSGLPSGVQLKPKVVHRDGTPCAQREALMLSLGETRSIEW